VRHICFVVGERRCIRVFVGEGYAPVASLQDACIMLYAQALVPSSALHHVEALIVHGHARGRWTPAECGCDFAALVDHHASAVVMRLAGPHSPPPQPRPAPTMPMCA
jgi:hypothetical protein